MLATLFGGKLLCAQKQKSQWAANVCSRTVAWMVMRTQKAEAEGWGWDGDGSGMRAMAVQTLRGPGKSCGACPENTRQEITLRGNGGGGV